mgnify:CR=1 FL=1
MTTWKYLGELEHHRVTMEQIHNWMSSKGIDPRFHDVSIAGKKVYYR